MRYLIGVLPPRNKYSTFLDAIKDEKECPRPDKLSPEQQVFRFADKYLKPRVLIHHVPLPKMIDSLSNDGQSLWPKKVVTASFVQSYGITQDSKGLLGSFGVIPRLEAQGLNLVDTVLVIDFEKMENGSYINTFDMYIPNEKEDKETFNFVKECNKFVVDWVKDHPNETEFPMPGDHLMIDCEPGDFLVPSEEYVKNATKILKIQAEAVFEPDELATMQLDGIAHDVINKRSLRPDELATIQLDGIEYDVIKTVNANVTPVE
jgi:hypothetical protein